MLKQTPQDYYMLSGLAKQPGLFHAISDRHFGNLGYDRDFTQNDRISKYLEVLGKKEADLVVPEQAHGNHLEIVSRTNRGKVIPGVDGIFTREKGLLIGVKTADCLPLLFFDPVKNIVGAVHAGWRGVYKRIPAKAIDLMIKMGSHPANILVGIGPAIGGCCYNVEKDRIKIFISKFGNIPGMVRQDGQQNYLAISVPALSMLLHSGICRRNIYLSETCTSCRADHFFSQRADKPEKYGSMLSVIGLRGNM